MKKISTALGFLILMFQASFAQEKATLFVGNENGQPRIDKNIYGMFSEHLGRGIYDGFWVGEKSDVPNFRTF